jgi:hypothetical protein
MTTTTDIRTLTGKLVAVEDTTIANGTPKIILSVLPFSSAQHPVNFGVPQFMQPLYDNVVALLYDPETAAYKTDIHVTTQSMKNSKGFIDPLSIVIAEDGVFYDSQDKRNTPPPMQKPVIKIVDEDDISDVLDKELINPYPFGTDAPVGMPKHLRGIITTWNTQLQIAFAQGYNLALSELSYQDDPDVYIDRAWFHFQAITHITHIKQAPEINGDDSQGTTVPVEKGDGDD